MNLANNPSLSDLSLLITGNATYFDTYDIIVDHDSEILIQPSAISTAVMLSKYKFYFKNFSGKEQIGILAAKNLRYLNQLYKNLLFCWENNLKGKVNYEQISLLYTLDLWLQSNQINYNDKHTDIVSSFFNADVRPAEQKEI